MKNLISTIKLLVLLGMKAGFYQSLFINVQGEVLIFAGLFILLELLYALYFGIYTGKIENEQIIISLSSFVVVIAALVMIPMRYFKRQTTI